MSIHWNFNGIYFCCLSFQTIEQEFILHNLESKYFDILGNPSIVEFEELLSILILLLQKIKFSGVLSNILELFNLSFSEKFEISKNSSFEQPRSIEDISVTWDVSNEDISNIIKLLQFLNIFDIELTFLVLKVDKSNDNKDLQT